MGLIALAGWEPVEVAIPEAASEAEHGAASPAAVLIGCVSRQPGPAHPGVAPMDVTAVDVSALEVVEASNAPDMAVAEYAVNLVGLLGATAWVDVGLHRVE